MFHRTVNLPELNSFFLFGPRGSGKSTLIRERFQKQNTLYVDLLQAREELRLSSDPDDLERQVMALDPEVRFVVIDEIQKVPRLLDVIHRLIESTSKVFVMTGSSAKKLKAGGANLLAGRAFERQLHPLTAEEIGPGFDLVAALRWGTLPRVFQLNDDESREDFLSAYVNTYLKEEIWAEHLIRRLDPFRKFLQVAAQSNGKIVNYSKIGRQVGADTKTVQSYYQILEDTLTGFILEPFDQSVRKRVHRNPKFYFFDPGVTRALAGILPVPPVPSTALFGELFEQWVILEFIRRESYLRRKFGFYYYHTLNDQEIDLVIERPGLPIALVEIKSTDRLEPTALKRFASAALDFPQAELFCLSRDPVVRDFGGIRALPWQKGLSEIFERKLDPSS